MTGLVKRALATPQTRAVRSQAAELRKFLEREFTPETFAQRASEYNHLVQISFAHASPEAKAECREAGLKAFEKLFNLGRQMGGTPQEEVQEAALGFISELIAQMNHAEI